MSGMIYRMKQNAVGLANICILSTMVLVMISSTSSMMLGMEDILKTRYPYDFVVYSDEEDTAAADELFDAVRDLQEQEQLPGYSRSAAIPICPLRRCVRGTLSWWTVRRPVLSQRSWIPSTT